jgi:hypothetical protein
VQGEPQKGGRGVTAPSIIREIKEVQGGEQVPRDGSLALPKDVEVKPLSLKGSLNTTLNVLVLILAKGSNGFLGGHADLNRSFPSLKYDSFQGILVVEVPAASFRPEVVQQEAPEDVQGLPAERCRVYYMGEGGGFP